MRIFLLGFMGVGKSTLGRLAAEQLSIEFLDFDTLIEDFQGMTISDIFANYGEPYFRKVEHDLLREVIQTRDDFVMGTGGGLPCFHHNVDAMNDYGYTVYLKGSSEAIVERLWNSSGSRPLIANKSKDELTSYVQDTLQKRSQFYEQASITLEIDLASSKVDNVHHLVLIINDLLKKQEV